MSGTERIEHLTHCPLCGLRMHSVKTPGIIDPWDYDGPLMVQPCTCVVPQEILRHPNAWASVVDDSPTIGVSGGVKIKQEYSGDGLGPIAGDFDEVAVYDGVRSGSEVGRYPLENVHTGIDCSVRSVEPGTERRGDGQ